MAAQYIKTLSFFHPPTNIVTHHCSCGTQSDWLPIGCFFHVENVKNCKPVQGSCVCCKWHVGKLDRVMLLQIYHSPINFESSGNGLAFIGSHKGLITIHLGEICLRFQKRPTVLCHKLCWGCLVHLELFHDHLDSLHH